MEKRRKLFGPEDEKTVRYIRLLAAATVQGANSGHPGAPMGLASVAHVLFSRVLRFSQNPKWINRDRFVLSAGHACALLYSMLFLTERLEVEDLKNFRQLHSKTPGHPETSTDHVEVCTGPLGQGVANAVGMAYAQRLTQERYSVDHRVYCICGDGCLQEGVCLEAISLAGLHELNNLLLIHDDNEITIDGRTDISTKDDIKKKFEACGWEVDVVTQASTDLEGIYEAVMKKRSKPCLIQCRTEIGYGSSKQNTPACHGAPLGRDEIDRLARELEIEDVFEVPECVKQIYSRVCQDNEKKYEQDKFQKVSSELKKIDTSFLPFSRAAEPTRKHSLECLKAIGNELHFFCGGSADLACSNLTKFCEDGRMMNFGIREHAMFAISNGIASYGLWRPFCATFLNFLTYGWGAARLSALGKHPVIYVLTHDSIELGEDGPTHQPVEVMALLRACPNFVELRPCNGIETSQAYAFALNHLSGPSAILLNRQFGFPGKQENPNFSKGCYILEDFSEKTGENRKSIIFVASGTEVKSCVEAKEKLERENFRVRVCSMPSFSLFLQQSEEYHEEVLQFMSAAKRVFVEASTTFGIRGLGERGDLYCGVDTFGVSAKGAECIRAFELDADSLVRRVLNL